MVSLILSPPESFPPTDYCKVPYDCVNDGSSQGKLIFGKGTTVSVKPSKCWGISETNQWVQLKHNPERMRRNFPALQPGAHRAALVQAPGWPQFWEAWPLLDTGFHNVWQGPLPRLALLRSDLPPHCGEWATFSAVVSWKRALGYSLSVWLQGGGCLDVRFNGGSHEEERAFCLGKVHCGTQHRLCAPLRPRHLSAGYTRWVLAVNSLPFLESHPKGPVETQLNLIALFSMQLLTMSDVWVRYEYMFPWRLDLVISPMGSLINCINAIVSVSWRSTKHIEALGGKQW